MTVIGLIRFKTNQPANQPTNQAKNLSSDNRYQFL